VTLIINVSAYRSLLVTPYYLGTAAALLRPTVLPRPHALDSAAAADFGRAMLHASPR